MFLRTLFHNTQPDEVIVDATSRRNERAELLEQAIYPSTISSTRASFLPQHLCTLASQPANSITAPRVPKQLSILSNIAKRLIPHPHPSNPPPHIPTPFPTPAHPKSHNRLHPVGFTKRPTVTTTRRSTKETQLALRSRCVYAIEVNWFLTP